MGTYINEEQFTRAVQECTLKGVSSLPSTSSTNQASQEASIFDETYVSERGNTCTDGDNDGKIGIASAIGNFVQGAGKALWNSVKGMVTDPSTGKFSLKRTLITAGITALSVAVPVVGLGLCAAGAVAGAISLGKGAISIATCETDAEKKDAFEQLGEGVLTIGVSLAGAKASFNAMKATSTAGVEGASALDSLKTENLEGLSLFQKAGKYGQALKEDAVSSSVNRLGSLKNTFVALKDGVKLDKANKQVSKAEAKLAKNPEADIDLASLQESAAKAQAKYDVSIEKSPTAQSVREGAQNFKTNSKSVKQNIAEAKKVLQEAKKSGDAEAQAQAQAALEEAQSKTIFNRARSAITEKKNNIFSQETQAQQAQVDALSQQTKGLSRYFGENASTYKAAAKELRSMKFNDYKAALCKVPTNLRNIITELKDGSKTYNQTVQEYGYNNVIQAIKAFTGDTISQFAV